MPTSGTIFQYKYEIEQHHFHTKYAQLYFTKNTSYVEITNIYPLKTDRGQPYVQLTIFTYKRNAGNTDTGYVTPAKPPYFSVKVGGTLLFPEQFC